MPLRNTADRYGAVAKTLHWLIALGLIGMMGFGFYLDQVGEDLPILERYQLTQLHKSVGMVLIVLIALRFLWRALNRPPAIPNTLKAYERALAHATHVALYAALIVFPLSGWVMASASALPIGDVFGVVPIPDLMDTNEAVEGIAHAVHAWMLYILGGLLALHIAGALKHHFVLKDDVLRRMLPGAKPRGGWSTPGR